jgi:hypothetical protein
MHETQPKKGPRRSIPRQATRLHPTRTGLKTTSSTGHRDQESLRWVQPKRVPGVLPLLDHHLPNPPTKTDPAWLAMPIAQRLTDALGEEPPLEEVVSALASIAATLAALHARGLAHRDVKPNNCYGFEDGWAISDFGLIESPLDANAALTVGAKALGPRGFMAPEMVLEADKAEGPPADVYSLGKTLWALAAGTPIAPIGEHRPEFPGKRLADWGVAHPRAFYLDRLIDQMTREIPNERPAMADVAAALQAWSKPEPGGDAPTDLSLRNVADAIADVFDRDRRVANKRQARQAAVDAVAADLARSMPDLLARLDEAGVAHSGISPDFQGVNDVLAARAEQTPDIDITSYRTCSLERNTGAGPFGFLRFGVGAALSPREMVVMASAYHLVDRRDRRVLWSDSDVALLGSSDYDEKVERLAKGLAENLQPALEEFFKAITEESD